MANLWQGDILTFTADGKVRALPDGFVRFTDDGTILCVSAARPQHSERDAFTDYRGKLILPAFCDLHLHAAQVPTAGLGYNRPFADWLTKITYPAEKRYAEPSVYRAVNRRLLRTLWRYGIMSAAVMGSASADAILDLLDAADAAGMQLTAGKMNADLDVYGPAPETTADSLRTTEMLLKTAQQYSPRIRPCVCPEFVPTCSDELLRGLGALTGRYQAPIVTHHAEGCFDVEMTARRFPHRSYAQVYKDFGLLGRTPTAMVHSVAATAEELRLFAATGTFVVHCPHALANVPADRAVPVMDYLGAGVRVGLGSDVGGGHTMDPLRQMVMAVQYANLTGAARTALQIVDAFRMVTLYSGAFFPQTGTLQPGYKLHALVVDDTPLWCFLREPSLLERLQRFVYCGGPEYIVARYCGGQLLREPFPEVG